MNTLTRTVSTIGGLLLLATPATPQGTQPAGPAAGPELVLAQNTRAPRRPQVPGGRRGSPTYEESFTRNVPLGAKGSFELSTFAGDVVITGVEGNTVRISATKRVRHPSEETARAILKSINIRITERGGFVEALTELPEGVNAPVVVDYFVAVPRDSNVSVRTFGGTLRVSNLQGELRADAIAGDVTLSSVNRIDVKALNGNLTISDSEGEEVNADTVGGTLQVRNVRARTIELHTVSGPVRVTDVTCDRCTLTSTSGDLELSGPLTPGGKYELRSGVGNIRLAPSGSTGFDVEARTTPGRFESEFPLRADPSRTDARVVYGTFGDGAAIVSLRTFQGTVSIVKGPR